nr:MATE family efflux transporter [uncultured Prevotella sp.]
MNARNKQILQLAVPSIISNITVPLLGLVDVAIVGHIGDASYIGAIAVGSMLFNVIYWLFGFLRMGTSGMTSQALGRRDFAEVMRLLVRSLSVGVGIGLLFFIFQKLVIGCGLWAMSPEANVLDLARRYCYVCIWGAPAVLGLYGFNGWYIGMQNTRIPMVVSLIQNVVNIVVSLVLVFCCHLTVEGVALGTVIAQWWGFLMAVVLARIYYGRLARYDFKAGLFAIEPLKHFFSLNRDIFLRTVCLVAVNLFFTAAGSRESTIVLAVNTLLMTLFTIFSYFMDGFAYAAEALSGKYYGAGNQQAFQEVVNRVFVFGGIVASAFTLLYIIGGENFLALLTSDKRVIAAAGEYFWWAVLIPLSGMTAFVFDGIFVGITQSKSMLASTAIASASFFVLFFGLHGWLGNHALWLAFIIYLLLRGIVLLFIYRRGLR